MSKKPFNKPGVPEVDTERRKFLKSSGAAIASGLAVPFMASSNSAAAGAEGAENSAAEEGGPRVQVSSNGFMLNRPNIIILITDQERYPMHWPTGWVDANLPNRRKLAKHGLTFTQAFTASSMCTPSRATLFTGLFPPEHKATQTLTYSYTSMAASLAQPSLQPSIPNMATMLASAGYDVQYRGKWHLSKDPVGTSPTGCARDLEYFGFLGWEPPEAGLAQAANGGGTADYDQWYAAGAADFLKNRKSTKPFALIVSLVNPHDIVSYPGSPLGGGWNTPSLSDMPPNEGTANYADVDLDASPLDQIGLPANFAQESYKPAAQPQCVLAQNGFLGTLDSNEDYLHYERFYAYLHMLIDKHIGTVLDALKSRPEMYQNTIVIRLSDHGEMGLSHGGLRQKMYVAYEEILNIPLVISNPVLFPKPVQTSALASSVDIMPTLATIANVPKKHIPTLRGTDLTPIIKNAVKHPTNPTRTVQDSVLFTTDERCFVNAGYVKQPACIRCLREARWKIAMYFDPNGVAESVYELYDLQNDPLEQNNLGNPSNPSYNADMLAQMKLKLEAKMEATKTTV